VIVSRQFKYILRIYIR